MESTECIIKEAVQAIQEFDFGEDASCIDRYIQTRMQNNDMSKIMNMEKPNVSLAVRSLLQRSQPTPDSVERSFSKLRKLLAKDRKFKVENVKQFAILHFNSFTWRSQSWQLV